MKAAGIAKGSFYSFYSNKEHLYMDILNNYERWIKFVSKDEDIKQELKELKNKMIQFLLAKGFSTITIKTESFLYAIGLFAV